MLKPGGAQKSGTVWSVTEEPRLSRLEPPVSRWQAWFPAAWIVLSVICLAIDYNLGPFIQFPIVYLVPVTLASWYSGRRFGLTLAVALPLGRFYFITLWDPPWTLTEAAINAAIRIGVLGSFAWLTARTASLNRALSSDVRLLSTTLPVCARCRKIHDAQGTWQALDTYVGQNPDVFTHELCPDCAQMSADVFDRR